MRLDLENVAFSYRHKNGLATKVFDNLHFSIVQAECVGIMGIEGAGKSTLLQLIAGLLKPDQGSIRCDDVDIWRQRKSFAALRGRIGFVFQFPEEQFFCETVRDELLFAHRNLEGANGLMLSPEAALRSVGLLPEDYLQRSPFSLSMGEARRVAIAAVLVTRPEVLLFDEPTVGLDGSGVDMFLRLMRRLMTDGATVLLASHDVDVLSEIATRIIIVGDGGMKEDSPAESLFLKEETLSQYGYRLPEIVQLMKERFPERGRLLRLSEARELLTPKD